MKNNKLTYLALTISSIFMLGGCSSLRQDGAHAGVQQEILKTVAEENITAKVTEQKLEEKPAPIIITETKKEARFNLFVNKAPVGAILQSLVDGTSYSLVMPEDLTGNLSLNLKNVTAFDVLETLKNVYHYDYEVQDKRIIVYPNGVRTKIFVMNHLIGKRVGNSELKVSSGSLTDNPIRTNTNNNGVTNTSNFGSGQQNTSNSTKVTTTTESDFWKEIGSVVEIMLEKKDGRSVVVSPETNTIVVRGLPKEVNEVEKYLRKVQAIIDKQVIIEAKLIEVQLNSGMQTGINWAAFGKINGNPIGMGYGLANASTATNISGTINNPSVNLPGLLGAATTLGTVGNPISNSSLFSMAFGSSNFASVLNFLETQGSLQVLSSPRIATLNNQKAILKVGTDEFFITNVTTTSTSTSAGTTSTPSVSTQPFFSGIALDITPQIDDNGLVTMHVHPAVSQVTTVTKNINLGTLGNLVLPLASSTISETDSIVKVESNKIVAIGGLMKQYSKKDRSQLPGVGDAPVVGNAFKNVDDNFTKYELVILLKPQVITTQADWETSLKEVRNRLADFDPPSKNITVTKNKE
jgi:MSHA biogenesis protein MshL